jgi:hypothetical protein
MAEEVKAEASASKSCDENARSIEEEQEEFVIDENSHSSAILYRCIDKYCNDSQPMSNEEQRNFEINMEIAH